MGLGTHFHESNNNNSSNHIISITIIIIIVSIMKVLNLELGGASDAAIDSEMDGNQ